MVAANPLWVLFCEGSSQGWRFVVYDADGSVQLEAADEESGSDAERLQLLALVRGLESLEQPAQLTLSTSSRYVLRGLDFGLDAWRDTNWQWEAFGMMVPVKNDDLWQRVDQALSIHEIVNNTRAVAGRTWRIDGAHGLKGQRPKLGRRWWGRHAESAQERRPAFSSLNPPMYAATA